MRSKIVLLIMTVGCLSVVVASTLAQTFNQPAPRAEADTTARHSMAETLYSEVGHPGAASPFHMFDSRATTSESAALSRRVEVLITQLKDAKSDADRDQKKTQLKDLLDAQFTARQQRHEKEIADLETKVKKLKELVAKRQENRREIVANRLDQILRDLQGLGW